MRAITLVLFVVAFLVAFIASTAVAELSESKIETLFRGFILKHRAGKAYRDLAEHQRRREIFKQNMLVAQARSAANPLAQFGVTKFSDMTPAEFRAKMLSKANAFERLERSGGALRLAPTAKSLAAAVRRVHGGPTAVPNFDWRSRGAVTRVKDQGQCGSCWSFSTTGNIEGQMFLSNSTRGANPASITAYSEQQLVSCDHTCDPKDPQSCDDGCNGGLMSNAFEYVIKTGYLVTEDTYPYKSGDGDSRRCEIKGKSQANAAKIASWTMLPQNETAIADYLIQNGPVSIAMDATPLQFYSGGIVSNADGCSQTQLDHGILLVGLGNQGSTPYWIVKNSWAADWGEQGYFKLQFGQNACGMATFACSSSTHA